MLRIVRATTTLGFRMRATVVALGALAAACGGRDGGAPVGPPVTPPVVPPVSPPSGVPPITEVVVAPDTVRLPVGELAQLWPILTDSTGARIFRRAVRYESGSTAIATVVASGVVRGVALGRTTVRVSAERGADTVVVEVVPPPEFRVTLRFLTDAAPEYVAPFRTGVARWEQVVLRRLPEITAALGANACGTNDPARTVTVQDLTINVRLQNIDGRGGVLGSAGPCLIRAAGAGGLPAIGIMQFDTTDLRQLLIQGTLESVITHEIGHVLGLGTLWNFGGRQLAPGGNASGDPRYVGPRAVLAARALGFTTAAGQGLLLEDAGGGGTRAAHWSESVFGNELMTGFANPGINPLSLITVEAMGDLGYVVSTAGAEAFGRLLETPLRSVSGAGRWPNAAPTP